MCLKLHKATKDSLTSLSYIWWQVGCHGPQSVAWNSVQQQVAIDKALDSRPEGLGFNSQPWSCIEASGKLHIPHCICLPSHNGCQVHRSKIGSIASGHHRCPPCHGKVPVNGQLIILHWCYDFKMNTFTFPWVKAKYVYWFNSSMT